MLSEEVYKCFDFLGMPKNNLCVENDHYKIP